MLNLELFKKYGFTYSDNYKGFENKHTFFGHIIINERKNNFVFNFMNLINSELKNEVLSNDKNIVKPICNETKNEALEEVLNNILYYVNPTLANNLLTNN